MSSVKIPYGFLQSFGPLTWRDVEFGLRHQYISPKVAIEFAAAKSSTTLNLTQKN
jgi:hypothetical protein